MNTILLIIIVCSMLSILALTTKKKNSRNKQNTSEDNYNNFYLGEITTCDIPDKLIKKEKKYAKWSSRQTHKKKKHKWEKMY